MKDKKSRCDCRICKRSRKFQKVLGRVKDKKDKDFLMSIYEGMEMAEFDNDCMTFNCKEQHIDLERVSQLFSDLFKTIHFDEKNRNLMPNYSIKAGSNVLL